MLQCGVEVKGSAAASCAMTCLLIMPRQSLAGWHVPELAKGEASNQPGMGSSRKTTHTLASATGEGRGDGCLHSLLLLPRILPVGQPVEGEAGRANALVLVGLEEAADRSVGQSGE